MGEESARGQAQESLARTHDSTTGIAWEERGRTAGRASRAQEWLESATRRWWFFLLILLLQFLPPATSFRFDQSRMTEIIGRILGSAYATNPEWRALYPALNSLAIIMLVGAVVLRNRWGRVLAVYAGLSYFAQAFLQNVAYLPGLGYGIVTNSVVMFLLVAAVWFLEAFCTRTNYQAMSRRPSRAWVIPLAAVALWYPASLDTMRPDFDPTHLLNGPAALAFCLMTPSFLALLILSHPQANLVTLRVTGIVGSIVALYNLVFLVMYFERLWWNAVLHLPLLIISIFAVVLGYRRQQTVMRGSVAPSA